MVGIMAFWIYLALVVFVFGPVVTWFFRVRVMKQDRIVDPSRCSRCDYNLAGLSVPRCPECGAAVGFTKTFDQLGIDEQQVIRHVEERVAQLDADGDTVPPEND